MNLLKIRQLTLRHGAPTVFFITTCILAPVTQAQITGPLYEGSTTVTGTVPAAGAAITSVQFMETVSGQLLTIAGGGTAAAVSDTRSFSAKLDVPLFAGQKVQLQDANSKSNVGGEMAVKGIAEWGRVRANFAAGTVLSFDNNFQGKDVTQSNLFLDFQVEKNWKWSGFDTTSCADTCKPKSRILFNTFFETRLTSIPEAQQQTPPTDTTTQQAKPGSVATPKADTTTTDTPDTLDTFVASRKSALMQAGAYLPILTNIWTWNNAPQALFIAPLAKVGFITPTGSADTGGSATTTTTTGSTTTTSTTGATQPVNPQEFYNYYGWGARIGHLNMSYDKNESPELVSYVDVIFGRYSNLETLTPVLASNGSPMVVDGQVLTRPIRQYRVGIEGTLKIPSTPFLIGFSANIGQNLQHQKRVLAANDDLRFFFGTKFDVGKLFGKLAKF